MRKNPERMRTQMSLEQVSSNTVSGHYFLFFSVIFVPYRTASQIKKNVFPERDCSINTTVWSNLLEVRHSDIASGEQIPPSFSNYPLPP